MSGTPLIRPTSESALLLKAILFLKLVLFTFFKYNVLNSNFGVFWDRVSLGHSCWPKTWWANQAGLRHTDLSASAWNAGIESVSRHAWLAFCCYCPFFFFLICTLIYFLCLYLCVWVCSYHHVCMLRLDNVGTLFSFSSTVWVPRTQHRWSDLLVAIYLLSHVPGHCKLTWSKYICWKVRGLGI